MAITKTIDDCNEYFAADNHTKSIDWDAYNDGQKAGAFAQAQRELTVFLGRQLYDPTSDDAVYQDPRAVYEQTLYLLENTEHKSTGDNPATLDLAMDQEKEVIDRKGVLISPMAQRYFMINRLRGVRG